MLNDRVANATKELRLTQEKMKIDDPDLSDADIDFLLGKEYQLNKDEYDEDEVRLSNIKLGEIMQVMKGKSKHIKS